MDSVAGQKLDAQQPEQYLFPVSFAQQRLWFLDQLEGPSAVYNVKLPVRLSGELDLNVLQRAVDWLVDRHESLRTSFVNRHGEPMQLIVSGARVPVTVLDMREANPDTIGEKVADLASRPFALDKGPLLRVHLLELGPDDHLLLMVCHHIVSDAWSSGIMFRDFAAAYDALSVAENPALPDLPVQYADYAVWQRDWLSGRELDRQVDYWRAKLAGAPPLLQLPTDRARPRVQTFNGSRISISLDTEATLALKSLAQSESCTLFMILLAGFNILLARYSGQDDVLVGSPIAGRRRSELESLIGLFANTLVFRTDLSGNPGFRELLGRVRANALDAFAHQELPFEKLVEALQPVRDMSRSPLFQVMFIHQNAPWEAQPIRGITVAPGEIAPGRTAKFDLSVSAIEYQQELFLNFEYNTDLFDQVTIEAMAAGFERLLQCIIARPDTPIMQLPVQSNAQRSELIDTWNRTGSEYPRDLAIDDLVVAQVQRSPDAIAVECGPARWSYRDLDTRLTALAGELRQLGAGSGAPIVAICVERSAAMVCAVLGVSHAQAAYLPLDPAYPPQRLEFMLQDSAARILITQACVAGRIPAFDGAVVLLDDDGCVDSIRPGPAGVDDDDSGFEALSDPLSDSQSRLAYLIYTSGSTGLPKGVGVPHSAVVNFLTGMATAPGLTASDRMLAVTTLSFDISVLELFLPLTVGAVTVVADAEAVADGVALGKLIDESRATVMQATPATWRMLLDAGWRGRSGLRILCGGEALDRALADQLLAGGHALWNMYGPTETTIWSTCGRIADDGRPITVGRPIANTRIYIVDQQMQAVPIGVAGELCIGGAGVARGYLNQAELTAERFVADPFVEGGRLYRTGDRARYRADGQIELLGRSDQQVKLRGFRIEPGEIEAALGALDGVAASAVALHDDPRRGPALVAYVVAAGAPVQSGALRSALQERLPDYMVPALYVPLAGLPLTANGKLDRGALPAPDWTAAVGDQPVAPRSAVEAALCSLYGELLGLSGVGIHDDFFALGGHSLLATQLVSRIRDALDAELPLKTVFESPSVAAMAAKVMVAGASVERSAVQPRGVDSRGFAPASFMQQRLWFLDQLEPGNPVYNLAWALRLRGEFDVDAFDRAVNLVVGRHDTLRTKLVDRDGMPMQVIANQVSIHIGLTSWLDKRASELDKRLVELARIPFDLRSGPLLRVEVLQVAEREQVLLLVIHHIVADGWSMSVLFRELTMAYNAYRQGSTPSLPALAVQYADYALWQREWLSGAELERQLSYWRGKLNGAPPLLQLPNDRPRPAVQTHRGAWLQRRVPASLCTRLQALARDTGCTLFMVLLAGFDVALARSAGQEDIVVGTPVAGRGRTELEGLIGFFVNTLVLRTDLGGNPTFHALLARVRQTALDAYAHQDLPFEKLVDELKPARDAGSTPVFQVMFNLHNEPGADIALDGIDAQRFSIDRGTSKFDLSVGVTHSGDGLLVNFEYNADLFDAETIAELGDYLLAVLEQVGANAGLRISELSLAEAQPRAALPGLVADTLAADTLVERFAAVVSREPRKLAVQTAQHAWSYGTLNARANRVAYELLLLSVWRRQAAAAAVDAPVARVGLIAGHDAPMLAGLLGILKSGAAYVPLEPELPAARAAARVADAGLAAVVSDATHAALAHALVAELDLPVVVIDAGADAGLGAELAAGIEPSDPQVAIDPDGLAYVLYTSGSSGAPKGVMQTHRGVLQQVATYRESLGLGRADRLSGLAGYGSDAAVQDLFGALLSGACVCPVSVREGTGAEVLAALVEARVTVLHATPTVYRHLLGGELTCRHDLAAIRAVVLGGEPVRRGDFELFKTRFARGTVFVNGLGLTESTLGLQFFADHDTRLPGQAVPVGYAVAGTGVELIDARGAPSWYGEIVLSGAGLAGGYWQDAALTRARFERRDGVRRYRSGDLGRRLPDGRIVHVGRLDDQVKLRGYRVEPGEIEAALSGLAGVGECAVVNRPVAGESRLVAYVVGAPGQAWTTGQAPDALRAGLATQLPDYMLPQAIEVLERLPRLATGKLDRAALPAPGQGAKRAHVPARTELEAVLTEIWLELLEVEQVGVHDDFFALGGHSLLATRLVSRVRDRLKLEVPLFSVFEYPTVAGLADHIEQSEIGRGQRLPGPKRRGRDPEVDRAV